jgi:amino acid transporter
MNSYTKTPVNTVWFDAIGALVLGLLAFAGTQAINAVFAISIVALYIAYSIPIAARFLGDNDFKPGPFTLGVFVSMVFSSYSVIQWAFSEPALCNDLCYFHDIHEHRVLLPIDAIDRCRRHELHSGRDCRRVGSFSDLVLFPSLWRRPLVHWTCG